MGVINGRSSLDLTCPLCIEHTHANSRQVLPWPLLLKGLIFVNSLYMHMDASMDSIHGRPRTKTTRSKMHECVQHEGIIILKDCCNLADKATCKSCTPLDITSFKFTAQQCVASSPHRNDIAHAVEPQSACLDQLPEYVPENISQSPLRLGHLSPRGVSFRQSGCPSAGGLTLTACSHKAPTHYNMQRSHSNC